jgi:hypothetical protein
VKAVQRSKGRSATGAAAYRSGEKIADERTGEVFDFTRKQSVSHTALVGWNGSREELWNTAELAERRKDATVAREYEIALPVELSKRDNIALAMSYGKWLNERHDCAVDICIHDLGSDNPHVHVLTTTRASDGDRLGDKIAREWSDAKRKKAGLPGRKSDLVEARERWEKICNSALARAGVDARIDCRSNAARGIEAVPTKKVGPKPRAGNVFALQEWEKRREENEKTRKLNAELAAVNAAIAELKNAAEPEPTKDELWGERFDLERKTREAQEFLGEKPGWIPEFLLPRELREKREAAREWLREEQPKELRYLQFRERECRIAELEREQYRREEEQRERERARQAQQQQPERQQQQEQAKQQAPPRRRGPRR